MTHNVSSKSNPQSFRPSYGLKHLTKHSIFSDRLHHTLIDNIPVFRHAVTTFPRTNPIRICCIHALARALHERYNLLGQVDDLEQSILHYTEAIFLPHPGHLYRYYRDCPNVIQHFYSIAKLLLHFLAHRTTQTDSIHPEDVTLLKHPVIYLRYLRAQPPEAFNPSPDEVIELLELSFLLHARFGLRDAMQDIEEMADLVLELLNSDTRTISTGIITVFVEVVKLQSKRPGDKLPATVIDCLRNLLKARIGQPDSDQISLTLAYALYERFDITFSHDDYEEGTAILDKFLTSHVPGDEPSQYREALSCIFNFAENRFLASGNPEHLEEAIYRLRNWLTWMPLEDPNRPFFVKSLTSLQSLHFEDYAQVDISGDFEFSPSPLKFFYDLIRSPSMTTTTQAEIEAAIEPSRRQLTSSHPSDKNRFAVVAEVGIMLLYAFMFTNNIEYLNEAISILREDTSLTNANGFGATILFPLKTLLLYSRFELRRSREDLSEVMQLSQMAVDHGGLNAHDRFRFSCRWAKHARINGRPCTSTAYDYALSSMQDALTFSPTVDIQHSRLVSRRDDYGTLPLDCASYQVNTGQLRRAVETLERGRALIWSEIRGLRSSIDQLRAFDSDLADKFAAINHDLEELTLTLAQNSYDDGGEEDFEGMRPFGRIVVQQRRLLGDRDKLISQIRAHKGLEPFLRPLSFDDLRSAAVRGPVIMINHNRWRSDIIILLRYSPPSLITTADDFYDRANELRDQLLGARREALDSVEYEDALRSVLKELYELVGRPVIQRLNELGVPEQSRVWWCPTSAFCSLPLHAMGPIPSDSDTPRYFLDFYIPSYTPTLSALIESNRSGSHMLGKPSLLLVVQQDESMKAALCETRVVQSVDTQVKTLISARATPPAVLKRLQDHRFVHIVCHGKLEPGRPFDSSFKLYKGNRLSLLDIIRSRVPNAEFAFLAACHTAELTDGSLSDEGLHLAAAMQYCGFRSVVGTMWAMADKDGPHLARNFYNSVFPPRETEGARYYERTAEALRDAMIDLRGRIADEEGSLERWVNFVHYGA